MKYINKEKCLSQGALKNTIFERNLLEHLEHPFIVNLRYAFQDAENMFMVLDLMIGGDLKYHLKQFGYFSEQLIKVYAAEIIVALEYLHNQGVIHRDIKPDNLLLDGEGHVHLTDFNVAAYLPENGIKLHSYSGTISYMAPEVIDKQVGYREDCDWWSLGVVLFEFAFGKRPFRGGTSKEVASRIHKGQFNFPSNSTRMDLSEDFYDLISNLLQRRVEDRLGVGDLGLQRLKAHPFFKGFEWKVVENKGLEPVFVPDPNRGHFNAVFEAEDILIEDKPLKPNKKDKLEISCQKPEMLWIRQAFKDYDFEKKEILMDNLRLLEESRKLEEEASENEEVTVNNTTVSDDHEEGEHEDEEIK